MVINKRKVEHYFNKRVKSRSFKVGNLVVHIYLLDVGGPPARSMQGLVESARQARYRYMYSANISNS